ncbi:GNAT family N-acetyltransferase [Intrasporangium calvum]|uniref:GNAT family N-acetyltransferase n=1 Tax=Intrasporangium calvum TaxID=53358 RepID=UPI00145F53CA|nr:GNAT family N-acetyltransferase [Intrasporangium calvum]
MDTVLASLVRGARDSWATRSLLSVMTDGAYGAQPADILIDPTIGAEGTVAPATARWHLRGGRFTPIRRVIADNTGGYPPLGALDKTPHVLVVMGGSDPLGCAPAIVEALARLETTLDVTVVSTPATEKVLKDAARRWRRGNLRPIAPTLNLPAIMSEADLVVTAAGTSMWELCALRRPMAVVAVVENQLAGYRLVIDSGAAIGLGTPADLQKPDVIANRLSQVLASPSLRMEMADAAHELVDGRGAWRIIRMFEAALTAAEPRGESAPLVEIRTATAQDEGKLLAWRNDPVTRASSRQHDVVSPVRHHQWLASSLTRDDRHVLIGSAGGIDIGTVRWDMLGTREWEVSITVAPTARGRALAAPLLAAGQRWLADYAEPTAYLAVLHRTNEASRRLFLGSGYAPDLPPDAQGFERWVRTVR